MRFFKHLLVIAIICITISSITLALLMQSPASFQQIKESLSSLSPETRAKITATAKPFIFFLRDNFGIPIPISVPSKPFISSEFNHRFERPSLLGYSHRFTNDYGSNVTLHIADEEIATSIVQYRIYDALNNRLVQLENLDTVLQVPHFPCASFKGDGCAYPTSLELKTSHLPEGVYFTSLVTDTNRLSQVIFFALRKPATKANATVALMIPENTWQAYNQQGGASFYTASPPDKKFEISYLRPIPNAPGNDYHNARVIVPLLRMLREQNIAVRMFTNEDLTWNKDYLKHVNLLLIVGHDEYWTTDLRNHIDGFAAKGGKVAVFGGNIGWAHANKSDAGSNNLFLYYGEVQNRDPHYSQSGYPFRYWINNPIEKTFGMTYMLGGLPIRSSYTREDAAKRGISDAQYDISRGMIVMDEAHPIFANTNLKKGDLFGETSHVMAFEIDAAPIFADGSINRTLSPITPEDLHPIAYALMFNSSVPAYNSNPSGHFQTAATIAERKLKSGGHLIHFGSIGWFRAWALGDVKTKQIFLNTLHLLGDDLTQPTNLIAAPAVISTSDNAADTLDALRLRSDDDGKYAFYTSFMDETAPGSEIFSELRYGLAVLTAKGHKDATKMLHSIDTVHANHLYPDSKQSAQEQERIKRQLRQSSERL